MKKIEPEYIGSWRITEMSNWDRDYIDEVAPGQLVIKANRTGTLTFGLVKAELDCRMEDVGVAEHLAFTFAGSDEMEETSGRGWAVAIGSKLEGRLHFHLGDDSTFNARREKGRLGTPPIVPSNVKPRRDKMVESRTSLYRRPRTSCSTNRDK
jgi:hypothetical protein